MKSDIEHAPFQIIVDSRPLFPSIFQHLFLIVLALSLVVVLRNKVSVKVASSTLAGQVSVVGRWHQTDRLRRTDVLIAELMRALLYHVGVEVILVVDDDVVGWPNMPLKAGMCLKVKVKQERGREAPILDCARKGVTIVRFLPRRRWVEPTVMPLSANDDGDLWLIIQASPNLPERLPNFQFELRFEYLIVLSLSPHMNRLINLECQKRQTSLTPSR